MSRQVYKKLKTGPSEGGSRNPTPKKKTVDGSPEMKFPFFYATYVVASETSDKFEILKEDFGQDKKKKYAGPPAKLLTLSNIPETWSVKSLAKMYDVLYEIYGNQSHGSGEDIVKAVIEMVLTQETNLINDAFAPETCTPPKLTNKTPGSETSTPTKLQEKNISREFVAKYIAQKTAGSAHSNFRTCYQQTIVWAPYEFAYVPHYLSKHTAQAILSWLSSYIILQAYRTNKQVRTEGKTFEELKTIWLRDLPNVYAHYDKFFGSKLFNCLSWDTRKFLEARFLPRIGEGNDPFYFIDDKHLLDHLHSSEDLEPGDVIKCIVKHVVAKECSSTEAAKSLFTKANNHVTEASHLTNVLNLVTAQNTIDKYHKDRLEDEVKLISKFRWMYMKYRTKSNFKERCTFTEFISGIEDLVTKILDKSEDRPTAKEEEFAGDVLRFTKVTSVEFSTQIDEIPVSEFNKYMSPNNNPTIQTCSNVDQVKHAYSKSKERQPTKITVTASEAEPVASCSYTVESNGKKHMNLETSKPQSQDELANPPNDETAFHTGELTGSETVHLSMPNVFGELLQVPTEMLDSMSDIKTESPNLTNLEKIIDNNNDIQMESKNDINMETNDDTNVETNDDTNMETHDDTNMESHDNTNMETHDDTNLETNDDGKDEIGAMLEELAKDFE